MSNETDTPAPADAVPEGEYAGLVERLRSPMRWTDELLLNGAKRDMHEAATAIAALTVRVGELTRERNHYWNADHEACVARDIARASAKAAEARVGELAEKLAASEQRLNAVLYNSGQETSNV